MYPKIKVFLKSKTLRSNGFAKTYIVSRTDKISRKYADWYYIRNLSDDKIINLDWKTADKWKQFSQKEVLVTLSYKNFSGFEVTSAKIDELNKWKIHNAYDIVDNER